MLYHASPTGGLTVLTPHVSNHGHPLVYFSKKRENVLVYLSNAVEKYCRDTGFVHTGRWEKWGPYGFDLDDVQRLEEYYPNALEETYAGVSGYIYGAEPANTAPVSDVPFAVTSEEAVAVVSCEFVPDAYEAILRAEREGLLRILYYAQTGDPFRAWIWQTMKHGTAHRRHRKPAPGARIPATPCQNPPPARPRRHRQARPVCTPPIPAAQPETQAAAFS